MLKKVFFLGVLSVMAGAANAKDGLTTKELMKKQSCRRGKVTCATNTGFPDPIIPFSQRDLNSTEALAVEMCEDGLEGKATVTCFDSLGSSAPPSPTPPPLPAPPPPLPAPTTARPLPVPTTARPLPPPIPPAPPPTTTTAKPTTTTAKPATTTPSTTTAKP